MRKLGLVYPGISIPPDALTCPLRGLLVLGKCWLQEVQAQQSWGTQGALESQLHIPSPGSQSGEGATSPHSSGLVLLKALATCKPP